MPDIIYKDPRPANRFYVYVFLREEDRTYYYVGKGQGHRAWSDARRNGCSRPSDDSRIILLKESITEPEAIDEEKRLIAFYGRKDLGTGILRNLTDGGEGVSGLKHSTETKDKMSEAQSGENHHNFGKTGAACPMFGKKHSPETRDKISTAMSGEKHPMFGKTGENHHNFRKKYKPREAPNKKRKDPSTGEGRGHGNQSSTV